MDRIGVVLAMVVAFANLGWLVLENGGQTNRFAVPITIALNVLAAAALGIEMYRVSKRRSSGMGVIFASLGLLFAMFVGALICLLRLPGPAI